MADPLLFSLKPGPTSSNTAYFHKPELQVWPLVTYLKPENSL